MSKNKIIDFESEIPLYIQVKQILKERFLSGKIDSDRLPTEIQLASEYNVNRMVVQRAIRRLCNEGYLYSRPKVGTFISQKKKRVLRIAYYELPAYSMKKILSLFEKSHPDVPIEGIEIPTEEYSRNITNMILSNSIDVVKVSESLFRKFDAPNLFYSLNRYVRKNRNATYVEPWNAFKYRNTYYGFPLAFSPVVMLYNKNLFDKTAINYPENEWNWDEFLDKAKKLTLIKSSDITNNQYGFLFSSHLNRWPAFILQNGGNLLKSDGKSLNLFSTEAREAIKFILNLMSKWKVAPVFTDSAEKPHSLFLRSKVAMTMGSYYHFAIFNKIKDFSWDIVPLPQKKRKATLLLADGFVASKKTTNYNSLLKFLSFVQSDTVQKYIKSCKTIIPVNKNIAEKEQTRTPRNYKIYKQVLPYAELLNLCHNTQHIQILKEETKLLWHGLQSYEETCEHIKTAEK